MRGKPVVLREQARNDIDKAILACYRESCDSGPFARLASNPAASTVDRLIDSSVLSIRYAVLTQLLGKLADPSRDVCSAWRAKA